MAKLIDTIPKNEKSFYDNKTDNDAKKYQFKNTTLKHGGKEVSVIEISTSKSSGYHYQQKVPKEVIVLHFTAGQIKGDIAALTKKNKKMSVAYVIARDGRIYQLFDPAYWSYHLGKGAKGGNGTQSKRSIGIELSNYGWLTKSGSKLKTYVGSHYCDITDKDYYQQLDTTKKFREKQYFATFTKEQYDNLKKLLGYLTSKFSIPYDILPEDTRYKVFESDEKAKTFKGISTHINYRTSGKWDIGPAFKWNQIGAATPGLTLSPEAMKNFPGFTAPNFNTPLSFDPSLSGPPQSFSTNPLSFGGNIAPADNTSVAANANAGLVPSSNNAVQSGGSQSLFSSVPVSQQNGLSAPEISRDLFKPPSNTPKFQFSEPKGRNLFSDPPKGGNLFSIPFSFPN